MNCLPVGFDFKRRAREEMLAEGFAPDFPPEVLAEVGRAPALALPAMDLRGLLWSSIDNTGSLDLDQAEWVEKLPGGEFRVLIGIAHVAEAVPEGGPTDRHAARNATSVYAGGPVFPMLPERLSNDATSLREDGERAALVIEFGVGLDGAVGAGRLYSASLRNRAKLTYDQTHRFLDGAAPEPTASGKVPGLAEQIILQREAAGRLAAFRRENGALTFGGGESSPVVVDNEVRTFEAVARDSARDIIESFMVAANVAAAQFLRGRGYAAIRRVVRQPKRWDRIQAIAAGLGTRLPEQPDSKALSVFLAGRKAADPDGFPLLSLSILKSLGPGEYVVETPGREREGHFGLAAHDYCHSTAPNRRYADLAMQRITRAALSGGPAPWEESALAQVAARCTERESAARHVERVMKKVAAAVFLSGRVGARFDAVVTGMAEKGTFARLLEVPAEGRVIRGERGLDVGHRIRARLVGVDVNRGFIDLAVE